MSNKSKSDNSLSLEAKNRLIAIKIDISDNINICLYVLRKINKFILNYNLLIEKSKNTFI